MELNPKMIDRLRDQVRLEEIIAETSLISYVAMWKNAPVNCNICDLEVIKCDDIIWVTDGINGFYVDKNSKFFNKHIEPKLVTKNHKNTEVKVKDKKPWWRRIFNIK